MEYRTKALEMGAAVISTQLQPLLLQSAMTEPSILRHRFKN
jgi:hypothetical protein